MAKYEKIKEGTICLATQLRYFRKKLGLKQAAMAEKLGVSQSLYTKLEVNASQTTPRRIEEFAYALHTTPAFLTHGTGPEYLPGSPEAAPRLTDELLRKILEFATNEDTISSARKMAEESGKDLVAVMTVLVKGMLL